MKKLATLFLFCAASAVAFAQDFSLEVGSGQTLYFNVIASGVEVTYPNHTGLAVNGWDGYTRPVGDLHIPSSVNYGGQVYDVVQVGQLSLYGCTGLSSVTVGNGVTWLGNSAFNGCSGLQSVVIPATVDTVGLRVFEGCTALAHVWCNCPVPPRTSPYAFYNLSLASSTLHVLPESQVAYAAAAPWSSFGSVVGNGPLATLTLAANDPQRGSVDGSGSYEVGTSLSISALPATGYAFICWNDGDERNPRPLTVMGDKTLWAMFFPRLTDTVALQTCSLSVRTSDENLGVGVGTADVAEGTVVEICALPLAGSFAGWSDGSHDNPRRVVVNSDMVLTAFFEQLAMPSVAQPQWQVRSEGRSVVVDGASGMEIVVYDAAGRMVSAVYALGDGVRIDLPAAGVYVVRVGEAGGRKVSVE
ncbi:MAG: leucine-rich repeat domain-containing protein [Bacteroidales bacterium]|nr:leucine-rich repeat domain-containing protein [Bacteroidales bacterium]